MAKQTIKPSAKLQAASRSQLQQASGKVAPKAAAKKAPIAAKPTPATVGRGKKTLQPVKGKPQAGAKAPKSATAAPAARATAKAQEKNMKAKPAAKTAAGKAKAAVKPVVSKGKAAAKPVASKAKAAVKPVAGKAKTAAKPAAAVQAKAKTQPVVTKAKLAVKPSEKQPKPGKAQAAAPEKPAKPRQKVSTKESNQTAKTQKAEEYRETEASAQAQEQTGPEPASNVSSLAEGEQETPITTKRRNESEMGLKQQRSMAEKRTGLTRRSLRKPELSKKRDGKEAATVVVKQASFDPDEIRQLREALESERERIIDELRTLDEQTLTTDVYEGDNQQPGYSIHLADSASDNQQVETALGIRSIEAEQLAQIDEALRSIERGDYGICHRCGETISIERLLVKPMARYCVPCLKLLESGKA